MSVRCSNCGNENNDGMKFCTNCGKSLVQEQPMPTLVGNTGGFTPQNVTSGTPAKKGGAGKNLAIFGGLGCLGLILVGILGIVGVVYWAGGSNKKVTNTDISINVPNNNSYGDNTSTNNNRIAKPQVNSNADTTADPSSTPFITDEQFLNFLPSGLGGFEQSGGTQNGSLTDDFPGADRIVKSDYIKGSKKVKVILAQFSSPATAKSSFGYFLDGFKGAGAKVIGKQKVRNKNRVETGEIAFYTYSKVYETMFYTDRFGFRITAPDRGSLLEFLKAFEAYTKSISTSE